MAGNGNEKQCESFRAVAVLIRDSFSAAGVVFPAGVLGVAAGGRARHFIIVRESPGVIVMVFCS